MADSLSMTYVAAPDRYDADDLPPRRALRPAAAGGSRSGSGTTSATTGRFGPAGHRPLGLRPGVTHFDLANNYGPEKKKKKGGPPPTARAEDQFRSHPTKGPAAVPERLSSRPRRGGTCGPARTASSARGSICWPAWTRAFGGSASTTSISSIIISSTRRPRSRRASARSIPRYAREGPLRRDLVVFGSAHHEAIDICARARNAHSIHQPSYSFLNRWVEGGLLDVLGRGMGAASLSPRWPRVS